MSRKRIFQNNSKYSLFSFPKKFLNNFFKNKNKNSENIIISVEAAKVV